MKAEGFLYTGKVEERVEGHFFFIVGNGEACHDGGRACRRHSPGLPIAHRPGKDRGEAEETPWRIQPRQVQADCQEAHVILV